MISCQEETMSTAEAAKASATKPAKSEFLPYYDRYISLVPDGDVVSTLTSQIEETLELLRSLPASVSTYRYAPDKWSVNQLVGHVIDAERLFSNRALRFARNDATPVPGFEQDDYVRNGPFGACRLRDLVDDFANVRQATISLFRQMSEDSWSRRGTANKVAVSVRALAFIILGHELHHRKILQQKYLQPRP
jgi:hypothetical protein